MQDASTGKTAQTRDKLNRLHAAMAVLGEVIFEWDLATDTILWSDRAQQILGLPELESVTTRSAYNSLIDTDDLARLQQTLVSRYTSHDPFECEYRIHSMEGELRWIQERSAVEFNTSDEPVKVCGVLRLVSRPRSASESVSGVVNYDEITGQYSRAKLVEALGEAINRCRRNESSGGYLSIGVDQLMELGETWGEATVDSVIFALSQRLEGCLRATDVIGRIGHDRFGVVLTHCPEEDVPIVAETLLQSVRGATIETARGPVQVTISIGGAVFPDVAQTAHDAIAKADMALGKARRMGYNCYIPFHQAKMRRRSQRKNLAILHEVQQAIQEDRLVFAFQPIVECETNAIAYYECLLRLLRDEKTVVTAAEFVPTLEQLGYARLIDHYAHSLALKELEVHPDVSLALNVSSLTATDPTWLSKFVMALKSRAGIAKRLIVEITETAALQDIAESARFVSTLRGLGCRVALDDFGAGFTSFHHLKSLPVDILKIDGSFVSGMSQNRDNQLLVKTLVNLAKGFHMNTVAECVETKEDVDILLQQGVHQMQGYYFGRPEIERPWLKESKVVSLRCATGDKRLA
ncbi:MAG: EAL domain-containing protein [Alphaproteobacteria bacterium]|nr:EAL domain-containing protein [Alphaproteobacteria bacterium]